MTNCAHSTLKIVPDESLSTIEIDGHPYTAFAFTRREAREEIICTMHRKENTNNLEVFRLAAFCSKHRIRLTMFGTLNQFPLFSLFADSVILADVEYTLSGIYDDLDCAGGWTSAIAPQVPAGITVHDLCQERAVVYGEKPTGILAQACLEIGDEEILEQFTDLTVQVRRSSYDVYMQFISRGLIASNSIVCEIKESHDCHGKMFRGMIERRASETGLRVVADRNLLRRICGEAGQHYMAVQSLAAMLSGCSWVCYGGSANLFSFFPFKALLLFDRFVEEELCTKLSRVRFGDNGFPLFSPDEMFRLDDALVSRIRQFTD
jgi:hypothetical protein